MAKGKKRKVVEALQTPPKSSSPEYGLYATLIESGEKREGRRKDCIGKENLVVNSEGEVVSIRLAFQALVRGENVRDQASAGESGNGDVGPGTYRKRPLMLYHHNLNYVTAEGAQAPSNALSPQSVSPLRARKRPLVLFDHNLCLC